MKFTLCIAALVSVALGLGSHVQEHNDYIKRQAGAIQTQVPVNVAAMSDAQGNVVEFDSKNVYLDGQARGL